MNYLEICQDVANKSGTIGDSLPSSVLAQTGRLKVIVDFVAKAWTDIQNARRDWKFQQFDYSEKSLVIGQKDYTGIALGLTDHQEWVINKDRPVFCYRVADGIANQYKLRPMEWGDFRKMYLLGTITDSSPIHVSVRPKDSALFFGPAPDVAHKVAGEYIPDVQVLAANADIPRLPVQHHAVITYKALMYLAAYDEAKDAYQLAAAHYGPIWDRLLADQIPAIVIQRYYQS